MFPCRVCGLDQGVDEWNPLSYDFCSCCVTEFGVHDTSLEQVRKVRMYWLTNGAKWHEKESEPSSWHSIENLTNQLKIYLLNGGNNRFEG